MQEMFLPVPYKKIGGVQEILETEDLQEEYDRLLKEHGGLVKEHDLLVEVQERLVGRLNGYDVGLALEVERLSDLLDEHTESKKAKDEDLDYDEDNEWDELEDKDELDVKVDDKEFANRDTKKRCKHLYRKIVKLSHPDKVNHDRYVGIYMEATLAYKVYDIQGLTELLDQLTNANSKIKSVRNKARHELAVLVAGLEKKIERLNSKIIEVLNSPTQEFVSYCNRYGFKSTVNMRKERMEEQLEHLKTQLDILQIPY